jgi:ATP-dependent RNA helicase DeaD
MQTFEEMGFKPEILAAIKDLGYEKPTPIQSLAIPHILSDKKDLIAFAQTGTGKTAAFSLPILENIDPDAPNIKCIILSPTRELGIQISKDIVSYSTKMKNLKVVPVYGGASMDTQIRDLKRGCDIVVGTPGRTLDLIKRKKLSLEDVQYLVLDEADEMLSMGFAEDLDAILANTPAEKQTLLFSATMPPDMVKLSKKYMTNPVEISAGSKKEANTNVHHVYYRINARDRYVALKRAVDFAPDIYGIIFCRTRAETKDIAEKLAGEGYNTDALHGDLSQAQRDYVMGRFRNRQLQLLIATDVAARGLDVQELTHVINYRLPDEDAVYVHRSGRTGRAKNEGISLSLLTAKEENSLRYLEKKIGRKFEKIDIPGGKEICEKQLFHLINNIIETEVMSTQIERFLPQINEMFADYSKEEIIKQVVSVEFTQFLNYYRNAPDLNKVSSDRRGDRDRDRGRDRDGRDRDGRDRDDSRRGRSRPGDENMTRYFINQGKKDGFRPKDLMTVVNELLTGKSPEIGQIEIMKMFSFFEMEGGHTADMQKALDNYNYRGRDVVIEESKPKGGGGGNRGGGRDRKRGGDRDRNRGGGYGSNRGGGHRGGGGRRRRR